MAELVGMSESGFLRGVKRGTLSVENLLDLARATDTPPSRVLRMAGKGKVADLIELMYGPGTESLTASQRGVLDLWARLGDQARAAMLVTLRELAGTRRPGKAR